MPSKSEITEQLVKLLPPSHVVLVKEAKLTWWHNLREQGGLRLTYDGYTALAKHLEFESWSINLQPNSVNKKLLLELDKKMTYPYYIKTRAPASIIFFGSRDAMMATLYGDLSQWLSSCQERPKQ